MERLKKKAYELRRDIIEEIYSSKAGHVGGDLSVVDILTVLYYQVMNISPKNMKDENRDRFLLSKGHCVDALYMVLGDLGFFDKEEAIHSFCAFNSPYIGHPNTSVPGIEINSGSLGHGLSLGVGMALAAKMDEKTYRTYVVLGDGEMAEGSNYEAMMSASHYKLDNLCATVDVKDGNDCDSLLSAYQQAALCKGQPTAVIAHTVKGKGVSFMENQKGWHHGVMNEEQYQTAVRELEEVLS